MRTPHETDAESMAFGHLTITYDGRVLRPRPWTVQQSHWAAELIRSAPPGPVLELCSGAGQIGLLAVALERRALVCVDASTAACDLARRNAAAAGLADLVEVREARLGEALRPEERFPVVIADPPWVSSADTGRYAEDPLSAIDGGADGLDLARDCLAVAGAHLAEGGQVLLQVGTREQAAQLDAERRGGLTVQEVRDGESGVLLRLHAG